MFTFPESLMNDIDALDFFTSPDYGYEVNDYGIITSFGKFEAEMWYAPYLWEVAVNNYPIFDGDNTYAVYGVNAQDRLVFGFDETTAYVLLQESEQGFISLEEFTNSAYNQLVIDCMESNSEEDY